jgi:hypothetical protein
MCHFETGMPDTLRCVRDPQQQPQRLQAQHGGLGLCLAGIQHVLRKIDPCLIISITCNGTGLPLFQIITRSLHGFLCLLFLHGGRCELPLQCGALRLDKLQLAVKFFPGQRRCGGGCSDLAMK